MSRANIAFAQSPPGIGRKRPSLPGQPLGDRASAVPFGCRKCFPFAESESDLKIQFTAEVMMHNSFIFDLEIQTIDGSLMRETGRISVRSEKHGYTHHEAVLAISSAMESTLRDEKFANLRGEICQINIQLRTASATGPLETVQ